MNNVEQYYTRKGLLDDILNGLEKSGIKKDRVTTAAIAGVDEFHVRGREVSQELSAKAGLRKGCTVLDAGSGLGGPARMLAELYGCQVTGIDITREFVEAATRLSALTGLQDNTRFVHGSALQLPFDEESFDVVWTQHVQMNIEDKQQFYSGIQKVLKKNGRFIYYDIFSNAHTPIRFPVPWASHAALSFLIMRDELHNLLQQLGMKPVMVSDETEKALLFFEKMFSQPATQGPPALGLNLLLGEDFREKFKNLYQNVRDKKLVLESGIWQK